MSPIPPITQKMLLNWAGPAVFRDGKIIFDNGLVQEAEYEPPYIRGTILRAGRTMRTAARILPDGNVESACPCRDSTERGIICSHIIAIGLELTQRAYDPEGDEKRQQELRRAARLASIDESQYIRRLPSSAPESVPAEIRLTLGPDWIAGWRQGRVPVLCEAVFHGQAYPLDSVERATPLSFSHRDESILYVLEDISEGPARGRLELSRPDLLNILDLLSGHQICAAGAPEPLTVNPVPISSILRIDLDQETGELVLALHTELPLGQPGAEPAYLAHGRKGWAVGPGQLWPLAGVLPEPLHAIYDGPVRIVRQALPRFLESELPALSKLMRIDTDVTPGLFTIEPAAPRFRLAVRGSPASLAATLHAEYEAKTLVAGKPDPAGRFCTPDPSDLLRYFVRSPQSERRALEKLRHYGFAGDQGDALSPIVGVREVLNFLGSHIPALHRAGWKVELQGRVAPFAGELGHATPVVHISAVPGQDWFEVGFEYDDGHGGSLAHADVQRAILKGDAYVERDGKTILLDTAAIEAMSAVFRDCSSTEGGRPGTFRMSNIYAAYVKSSLDGLDGVDIEAAPAWRTGAERQNRELTIGPLDVPGLEHILRPYQRDGIGWLRFLEDNGFCGILADEMGLGKTLQTLAWLQLERSHPAHAGKPALIVCPTSLVENWAEEAHRFVPSMKVLMLTGNERHALWDRIASTNLVVTSYALMRRDVERYLQTEFSVLVLDEAQHIKNRSTQNAITAKRLRAGHRLVLTGTPIENGVSDLWSILDFLMPGYLGPHESFRRHYELPIAQGGFDGEEAQVRLRRKLNPFLLRRMKADVARELPPKIERVASCTLTADQQQVYRTLVEASRRTLADLVRERGFKRCTIEVLKTLLQLRQVCCHIDLLHLQNVQSTQPSAKLDLFLELVDEAIDGGHRILVFSQFVSMLTILRRELDARPIRYCYLDGATKERQKIVHEFNADRSIPLFLISLKAGGTGLNLTGADTVIHFDPWWNPAVENQATDRAYRIGQHRTVYSIKLITKGTIEEKVLALQKKKKSIIDATLATDESILESLTWEDVEELLRL